MPNRLFRHGFIDSESIVALSDWAHRVYSNLLICSDDAGRIDGRLEFLRSCLFPLGTTKRIEDVHKAIVECAAPQSDGRILPPLLMQYQYGEKPFIQLAKIHKYGKGTLSRCPWKDGSFRFNFVAVETRDGESLFVNTSLDFDSANGVPTPSVPHRHPIGTPSRRKPLIQTGTGTGTSTGTGTVASDSLLHPILKDERFAKKWEEWVGYRQRKKKPVSDDAARKKLERCAKYGVGASIAAIDKAIECDWQGFFPEKETGGPLDDDEYEASPELQRTMEEIMREP